jgi:hypothetical protein
MEPLELDTEQLDRAVALLRLLAQAALDERGEAGVDAHDALGERRAAVIPQGEPEPGEALRLHLLEQDLLQGRQGVGAQLIEDQAQGIEVALGRGR